MTREGSPRFRIKGEAEEIAVMLKGYYEEEVAIRGGEFDTEGVKDVISSLAKWLTGGKRGSLLLYGAVGNGKSTLLKSLVSFLANYAPSLVGSRIFQADEIVGEVKQENGGCFYDLMESKGIVFIDDFGVESVSVTLYGDVSYPLTSFLYHRYNKLLPTVMTTNLLLDEIEERYDKRLFDRMREQFDFLFFGGCSFRKL